MNHLLELWEKPAPGKFMIAGWRQWADAGSVSSALPQYLIEQTKARKIGEISPHGFYLFQIPGTHHLLRPIVKLSEGHRQEFQRRKNEFFYSGDDTGGLLIFLGDEPHHNEERYADVFLDAVEAFGVERVAAVGGVYGAVPYDKNRNISCVYSLPEMKKEMADYAVRLSNYEGGTTIGTYLADRAESRGIEFLGFYAFVPAYDFSQTLTMIQPTTIEEDFKAWYDLMLRLKHMFNLDLDLSDLERRSDELISEWDAKIDRLSHAEPRLEIQSYMEKVNEEFSETFFEPLSDVWREALGHLFDDAEK